MKIHALPVPSREPLNGKGVPKVVRPRAYPAFGRL